MPKRYIGCVLIVGIAAWAAWFVQRTHEQAPSPDPEPAAGVAGPNTLPTQNQLVAKPAAVSVQRTSSEPELISVTLHNPTSRVISILGIEKTCECTVPKPLENDSLAPGESTTLQLSVLPPEFGRQDIFVSVRTDVADAPDLEIPISLNGDPQPTSLAYVRLEPVPRMLEFSGYTPGKVISQDFSVYTIENRDSKPWITGLKCGDHDMTAEVLDNIREQRQRELEPYGLIERVYRLKLQTRLPHWETVEVPIGLMFETAAGMPESTEYVFVRTRCHKPISVAPETIFVGTSGLAAGAIDRVVVIRSFDDHELTLNSIRSECSAISASIENQQSESEPARVSVKIASTPKLAAENGHTEATVRIETNHPLLPTLEIAVFIHAGSTKLEQANVGHRSPP